MKYVVYKENDGIKPRLNDYITFEMVYKDEHDSVLFDSRNNSVPFRMQLERIPFKGSMEEGLTYLSEGDSAAFFVSADSLNEKVFRQGDAQSLLRPGSKVRFDIKILKIQPRAEAEKEIKLSLESRMRAESKKIREYIEKNNIVVQPDSNGIYIICDKLTNSKINDGDIVSVKYKARFLNGLEYDTNKDNQPMNFVIGSLQVSKGWEIAMKRLEAGSKASILIPSAMAYGETGLRNTSDGTYIVPPYTPIVIEVEVLSVTHPASPDN